MSFFDKPKRQPPPMPPPHRERWRGQSHDTVGIPVPLVVELARTDDVAVLVSGIVAYPAGFAFSLVTLARMQNVQMHLGPMIRRLPFEEAVEDALRFGVRCADGSTATNLDEHVPAAFSSATARRLQPGGGGGGGRKYSQSFWCEPLPPRGEMGFVIAWPKYGIDEREEIVDAGLIVDAASDARAVWPDDIDLPDEQLDVQSWQGRKFSTGTVTFSAGEPDVDPNDPEGEHDC